MLIKYKSDCLQVLYFNFLAFIYAFWVTPELPTFKFAAYELVIVNIELIRSITGLIRI